MSWLNEIETPSFGHFKLQLFPKLFTGLMGLYLLSLMLLSL